VTGAGAGSPGIIAPDGGTPVEIETGPSPGAAVIWLHGLGADGHDFEPIVPELRPGGSPVRFVFPHAPYRPVTINGGYLMRAWYDLALRGQGLWQNEEHLREAMGTVAALVQRENARGIPGERIVLAGFSQGANVVLHAGLSYPQRLAGVLALSAPLLAVDRVVRDISPANRATPVFLAHGDTDNIVPPVIGREAGRRLAEAGIPVTWHEYPMGHSVCAEEIAHISQWFSMVVP
jgi:phospholipase/carboxylesterase